MGSKVNVNFGNISMKPCWFDEDFIFWWNYFQTICMCKFFMARGESYWLWAKRFKIKVLFSTMNVKYWGKDTGYIFLPNHFTTSEVNWSWQEKEAYWIKVTGSKVKVNFGTVLETFWVEYRIQLMPNDETIKLMCKFLMMRGRNLLFLGSWGHGAKGQGHLFFYLFL